MSGPRVHLLYTNIGRGHPFYLDGIRHALSPASLGAVRDVFQICRGPSGLAWRLARSLYTRGSSQGGANTLYSRLRARTDYTRAGPALALMGGPLRRATAAWDGPLVVAHPLLVAIFRDRPELVYQHGELAVPREALLPGSHRILVPDARAADGFLRAGIPAQQVIVTGLNVEPALVPLAAPALAARLHRYAAGDILTGAFFSSGAEPAAHVDLLVTAARAVAAAGHPVIVVARFGGRLHRAIRRALQDVQGAPSEVNPGNLWPTPPVSVIATYSTREELEALTAAAFARFDYLVAPAHERCHWALGLGLPMFMLEPSIGTFAPLNRDRLLEAGVAEPLPAAAARDFADLLAARRRTGALARMSAQGWDRHPINGFARAAEALHR